jgi:hypothetical protein
MSASQVQQWLRLIWNTLLKIHWKQADLIVAEFKQQPDTDKALVTRIEQRVAATAAYATEPGKSHDSTSIQFLYEWCKIDVAHLHYAVRFIARAVTSPSARVTKHRKEWNQVFLDELEAQYREQTQYATTFANQNANRRVLYSKWPLIQFPVIQFQPCIPSEASTKWRTAEGPDFGMDTRATLPAVTDLVIDTSPEPDLSRKRKPEMERQMSAFTGVDDPAVFD